MLMSFIMNIALGKFGYYITFALNFVQFMLYTYEYIRLKNESAPMLLVMTFIIMVIDMLLQYYIIRLASKIQHLEDQKREERGKAIRRAFVARDAGHRMMSADYSQIELRLMAAMSGDAAMLEAFRNWKTRCSPVRASSLTTKLWAAPRLVKRSEGTSIHPSIRSQHCPAAT